MTATRRTGALAAALTEVGGTPQLQEIELREPVGAEVRVRIDAVGICHTDISLAGRWPAKRMPMVFGHEGTGVVEAAGPDSTLAVGGRVVLTFNSCGRCRSCVAGAPAYCERSTALNMRGDSGDALSHAGGPVIGDFFGQSSFSTYALAHQRNAIPIDGEISPALAAPLGCSVQTGVGAVLNALSPDAGQALVVFGAGAVGLCAVMGARIAGCGTIVAVDPKAERRAVATELGATHVLDPAGSELVAELIEITGGGADHALDTTALPSVLSDALTALRPRGQLGIVGLGAPTADLPVGLIMGRGLRVRGVVEGDSVPEQFIPELLGYHSRGDLPLEKLVTTYDFADFGTAWKAAVEGSAIKPVLTMPA